MEVYSGSSGTLIEIACDDNNGDNLFSSVTIIGRTPGEVLLIRVWEFGDDLKGNFNICAWSSSSLGLQHNTFEGFTYYPNPVKDILKIKSSRAIDKVEVFNVLGQGIISIDLQNTIQNIDMSNVQVGVYFIIISIENQTNTIRVIKQ
ncbi:T9SS type A sorting domain-containing protein [Psychroserpens sp. AS72]|uniref:T9SS type A sorting domain-containing protein n=1 Tax=Psychroserpens sp. AS72 TaxID=3135775 RepID=UPI003174993E